MKRLILTQQQLADAYAVPVKSSIYQYFLGLSDRKEKMIGLIIGERNHCIRRNHESMETVAQSFGADASDVH